MPWSPLWVASKIWLAHNLRKIVACPPLWNLGWKFGHTNGLNLSKEFFLFFFWSSPNSEQKIGTEYDWRPFFFCSSSKSGQINELNLSPFFWNSWLRVCPPPFENPAYATGSNRDIIITKAEKSNAVAILHKSDYLTKINVLHLQKFQKIGPINKNDSTARIDDSIQRHLLALTKENMLAKPVYEHIRPSSFAKT